MSTFAIPNEKNGSPNAEIAQLVEHNLAKVGVAGSSPVFRSKQKEILNRFNCENSSVGRAQPCQGWGRGFESRFSLKAPNATRAGRNQVRMAELVDALL